jgi:tRNA (mo5U34)-methyltransferase
MKEHMISFEDFYKELELTKCHRWLDTLPAKVEAALSSSRWGDYPKWCAALDRLPDIKADDVDLNADRIRIGTANDCDEQARRALKDALMEFHPWRKGPFELFGLKIDTEWRCEVKWNRLKNDIASLKGRMVLDVGSSNGYYTWRMAGAGAKLAAGIDPTLVYPMQFQAVQKYIQNPAVTVLPLGIDDMPFDLGCFDTVFSMGLLYHRRLPLEHLLQLRSFIREGGELVLETLVIEGKEGDILDPAGRYAKMPNVWAIPSCATLETWLKQAGFTSIRCINVEPTTVQEQRTTEWMGFESLADFLDPKDHSKTIEGHPAPLRAIFLAENPKVQPYKE